MPDKANPALTKGLELYMGRGLAACPAISGALVSGADGGVGVPHAAEEGMEQENTGRALEPHFPWGTHGGTSGGGGSIGPVSRLGGVPCEDPRSPPPVLCPSHGCCWAHFFPKILVWKSSSLLRVHPKRGMAWGSTLWVPNLGAAAISQLAKPSHVVMGGETGF